MPGMSTGQLNVAGTRCLRSLLGRGDGFAALLRGELDGLAILVARINGETVIDRPLEVVFGFVSEESNQPRYNPQMLSVEKLSPGNV